ncbi:MAG: cysteine desulfurase, partial [Cyanobium sp.]
MTLASNPPLAAPSSAGDPPDNLALLTRPDFPLLDQTACLGQPLIYLDYAATSQ